MIGERTLEGRMFRLRPRGVGRFFSAAFLLFWLCGWAIGEGVVLWLLVRGGYALITGTPPDAGRAPLETGPALAVGAFLLVWLSFWTLGGIAAIGAVLQLLWAEDRIIAGHTGIAFHWSRGPFRGRREYPRDRVRAIGVTTHQRRSLVLETDTERIELSSLGTLAERQQAVEAMRAMLKLSPSREAALPKGWEEAITPEGERVVVPNAATRRVQARAAWMTALGMSAVALWMLQLVGRQPALIPFAVLTVLAAAGLAWGAAWLAYGRKEFRLGAGSVTLRRRFRSKVRDLFEAQSLELTARLDSDGDEWFELKGSAGESSRPAGGRWPGQSDQSRTFVSKMNDSTVPRHLGSWMARTAGVPFTDYTVGDVREA
jgi:hypothetical protein